MHHVHAIRVNTRQTMQYNVENHISPVYLEVGEVVRGIISPVYLESEVDDVGVSRVKVQGQGT